MNDLNGLEQMCKCETYAIRSEDLVAGSSCSDLTNIYQEPRDIGLNWDTVTEVIKDAIRDAISENNLVVEPKEPEIERYRLKHR